MRAYSDNGFGDRGATVVARALGHLLALERADLDHNGLGTDGALAVARGAIGLSRLRTLYLRNFEQQDPMNNGAKSAIRAMLPQVCCRTEMNADWFDL